jgi:hypothetical protein
LYTFRKGVVIIVKRLLKNIYFLPAFISLLLIGLLLLEQINEKTAFPAEGWSRSVPLAEETNGRTYFVNYDDNSREFHAYTPIDNKLLHLVVDEQLNVQKSEKIALTLHKRKPFYAHESKIVYYNENKLILYEDGKSSTLVSGVAGVEFDDDYIIYWKGNDVYSLNLDSLHESKIITFNKEISKVVVDEQTMSIIVLPTGAKDILDIGLFRLQEGSYKLTFAGEVNKNPDAVLADLAFLDDGEELHFIYTAITRKQGVRKSKTNYITLSLQTGEKQIHFTQFMFIDKKSNKPLMEPVTFDLFKRNDKVKLLFSAKGKVDKRNIITNIYEAEFIGGVWASERRSTTYRTSVRPSIVNETTIVWLDFLPQETFSNEKYILHGASQNERVVERTASINMEDVSSALADTFTTLPQSVFILFFAFLWIVPPVLFLIVLAFINPNLLEKQSWKIRLTAIGLLLVTQYFVFKKIKFFVFVLTAPAYLTFENSLFVYSFIVALISLIVVLIVKDEDWTPSVEFVYFTCINALFLSLLLGSYLI